MHPKPCTTPADNLSSSCSTYQRVAKGLNGPSHLPFPYHSSAWQAFVIVTTRSLIGRARVCLLTTAWSIGDELAAMRELLKKMQDDSADLLGERRLGETWTVGSTVHGYSGPRGARSSTTASSSDESDMSVSASSGTASELGLRGQHAEHATGGLMATHGMDTSGRSYYPLFQVLCDRPGHLDVSGRRVRERPGSCDRRYEHTYEHTRERERHVDNDTYDSDYFLENDLDGEPSRRPVRHAIFTDDRGMVWPDRMMPDESNARYRPRRGNEHNGLCSLLSQYLQLDDDILKATTLSC
jgi:hypothetical protein